MSVSLIKGQKISLAKEAGQGLSKIFMGLGWDAVKKGGLLGKFLNNNDIDLDASCVLFSAEKQVTDVVYFGQLTSKDGSIVHTGDNLTGEGEGDDEVIRVDLNKVPASVQYLVFTVSSYRGQTFNEVENAFCRLVDENGKKEIARYTISGGGEHTAMIMAKLYRHNGEWKMHAVGESMQATTVADMIAPITAIL